MLTPLLIFEDTGWQRLLPLVYIRAAFQLTCGMGSLLEKVRRLGGDAPTMGQAGLEADRHSPLGAVPIGCWCRPDLRELVAEQVGLPVNQPCEPHALLLNGRGLWHQLPSTDETGGAWVGTTGTTGDIACIRADAECP